MSGLIEFEIKIPCVHDEIRNGLNSLDAKHVKTERNEDHYFHHPCKNYEDTDEALRIRLVDGRHQILTYKGPKIDTISKSRVEVNSAISSNFDKILDNLGFKISGHVSKLRDIWRIGEISIMLDKVENLGDFVEFEIMGEYSDREEKLAELNELILKLGLDVNNQIRLSYLELLQGS